MTKEGRGILEDEAMLVVEVLPNTRGIGADPIAREEVGVTRTEVEDFERRLWPPREELLSG
jgi:hypothetical protein